MSSDSCQPSSFLHRGDAAASGDLAVLYLRRDLAVPIVLQREKEGGDGYAEGVVTNTRFGSFPHSTLTGVTWGAQVRASAVDTGSRGKKSKKRKRGPDVSESAHTKTAAEAASGFAHLLPPTVESWCTSLPHRTQVVYTPDYAYVLQRLRVRPGSVLIEAGAGSGAFTHAAARAVHGRKGAKVWSFEFHEQRVERLRQELLDHRLDSLVTVTHRDVYEEGFDVTSDVRASAIFLDLPAPWLALRHLTREGLLETRLPARICTFSPCIEQVQRTVQELREFGWLEIEMVEIAARRIEVRREQISGSQPQRDSAKGVPPPATSVEEAVGRLREIEKKAQLVQGGETEAAETPEGNSNGFPQVPARRPGDGPLVHRPEPELKAHTSYLVFAVMPVELVGGANVGIPFAQEPETEVGSSIP